MKKLLLTSMMILLTASSSMSARITLDESVDATLDGNASDATGKDWRLTDFSNFADLNTMLTEIYGWSWYTQDQIDAMILSKTNTNPYTPTANYHPATKLYADSLVLPLASQAQMEAGTDTDVLAMSPLRVKQAIDALATGVTDAELIDIAGITFAQGDILTYDGSNVVKIGPGTAGQYLKTGGVGADVSWGDPAGSGDITAVGDSESGAAFTPDGTGNVIYFEGTTANSFEIALTGANPSADVVVTIPAATDTLVGKATTDVLTNKDLTSGTNTFPTFNQDTTGNAATATLATNATNATNATTATTATTANAGDSATLFFTSGTIEAARLPDLSGTYEPADTAIVKSDEAETISADWINTANPWAVNEGGTGVATLNDAGLLVGNGTSGIEALADGLTTQVLVGGGADTNPTWSTDLPGGTTLGSQYIYRIGGTDVADADVTNNLTINAQDGSTWNVVDSVTTTSVYNGSTSLEESTSATDSGAYIIGVYDDFTNATATNVQGVLKQFDTAISGGGSTLGDILTTTPLLINGGANLNDILPGVDADVTISIPAATTSANGYLTATDWNTFNGKQDALTSPIIAAGAQSITGIKTFTASPIVPTPTTDYQAAPKGYVDGLIPTNNNQLINGAGYLTQTAANAFYAMTSHNHSGVYEAVLGNPSTNGYVLSSTTGGTRSWIPQSTGSFDPTGNIAFTGINTHTGTETFSGTVNLPANTTLPLDSVGADQLANADLGDVSVSGGVVTVDNYTHNHAGTYEPADATILKDADIGISVLSPTGDGSGLTGINAGTSAVITGFVSGSGTVAATDTILEAIEKLDGNIAGVSVGSPLVAAPTYSDDPCVAGTYAYATSPSSIIHCRATNIWDYQEVSGANLVWAGWDSPAPATYTLSLTLAGLDGDSVNGVSVAGPTNITGLTSSTYALTETFGSTNNTVVCTGSAVTGSANDYLVDMSDSNESATCTFSESGGVGACDTLYYEHNTLFSYASIAQYSSADKVGVIYRGTETTSVCSVSMNLRRAGAITENVRLFIYTTSGNNLDTLVAMSNEVNPSGISTAGAEWVNFTFSSTFTLTDGVAITIGQSDGGVDAANYLRLGVFDGGSDADYPLYGFNAGVGTVKASNTGNVRIYE